MRIKVALRVGDRNGNRKWSVRDIAFCLCANPSSDGVQLIVMIYECD